MPRHRNPGKASSTLAGALAVGLSSDVTERKMKSSFDFDMYSSVASAHEYFVSIATDLTGPSSGKCDQSP